MLNWQEDIFMTAHMWHFGNWMSPFNYFGDFNKWTHEVFLRAMLGIHESDYNVMMRVVHYWCTGSQLSILSKFTLVALM